MKISRDLINLLISPLIDPQEVQEGFFLKKKEIDNLKSSEEAQDTLIMLAEKSLRSLWGSVLRAATVNALAGDTQALKLLFDYVDKRRIIDKKPEEGLGHLTEQGRRKLAEKIRRMIKEIREKKRTG